MNIKKLLVSAGLLLLALTSSAGWSATVYAPTNQNVNFINDDNNCYLFGTNCPDAILGIFDDSDTTYSGNFLAISLGQDGDTANFAETIGQAINYNLSNNSGLAPNSFMLTGNDNFLIALRAPASSGSWVAPTLEQCSVTSESCLLTWNLGSSVFAIDLEQVVPPAEVPVPASVWLFGSGLLGLVGIARRKKTA